MKKNFFLPPFFLIVLLFALPCAFAEITVINPAPGSYCNLQSLVIESNGGEEIYYSFSGSDPLSQGLAYDGPVVLDITGNVMLRIAAVDKSQNKSELTINYFVDVSQTESEEHNAFLKSFETGPCFEFSAGSKLDIPFTMGYSFFSSGNFEKGREISISKKATMERYVPVNLRDSDKIWRYVLHVTPNEAGALSRFDAPFKIDGWNNIVFTDPKLIYSLDGSWWQSGAKIVSVDRSLPVSVYYQSADYSSQNPITKIDLPPKPAIDVVRLNDGSVKIRALGNSGDKFYLAASSLSKTRLVSDGLYPELTIDAFPGESIDTQLPIEIYSGQVFQGILYADVSVNRLTPNIPVIKTSASSSYARDDVWVSASCSPKLKLYCSVSNPIEIEPSFEGSDLKELQYAQGQFNLYDGQKIALYGDSEKILAYKVSFYSEDEMGAKSATVDYSVAIDKYNYYVDSSSKSQEPNGTPFEPFRDLSALAKIARQSQFCRFFIKGSVVLTSGEISLLNNVELVGIGDALVSLPTNCAFVLKNSGFYAQNIIFEKQGESSSSKKLRGAAKALTSFFVLDHSAATFKNCEIIARFLGDGRVFDSQSSSLKLEGTGISSSAQGYSCAINASGPSKITVLNSRVLSVADTAVAFSSTGGRWNLDENFAQVAGRMGRPAEFIDTVVSMTNNKFTSQVSSKPQGYKDIYTAGKVDFISDEGNIYK